MLIELLNAHYSTGIGRPSIRHADSRWSLLLDSLLQRREVEEPSQLRSRVQQ